MVISQGMISSSKTLHFRVFNVDTICPMDIFLPRRSFSAQLTISDMKTSSIKPLKLGSECVRKGRIFRSSLAIPNILSAVWLGKALSMVTAEDAQGCFKSCGYIPCQN